MGRHTSPQTVGYRYYMGMHLALCQGPVDALEQIFVNKILVWAGPQTSTGQIYINDPVAFGGDQKEGGIQGLVDVMMGYPNQAANDYLTSILAVGQTNVNPSYGQPQFGVVEISGFFATEVNTATEAPGNIIIDTTGWSGYINQLATWNGSIYTYQVPYPGWQVEVVGGTGVWTYNGSSWVQLNQGMPAFRGVCSLVARRVFMASMNPYIKPWTAVVKRILQRSDGQPQWEPSLAESPAGSGDMNPAHIILECLTNTVWGRSYDPTTIDNNSFLYAAQTLFNSGIGLSMLWDNQGQDLDAFIQTVLEHINGSLYMKPGTGQWTLKLILNDYTVANLVVMDQSNILRVTACSRPSPFDLPNQVTATYHDRTLRKDVPVVVQNIASIAAANGQINNTAVDRTGFSNNQAAILVAIRDLQTLSTPLLRATLLCNRTASQFNIGDVFVWNWPELGINQVVMRIAQVNFGTLLNGTVTLDCIEDVFAYATNSYLGIQPTGWASPYSQPAPAVYRYVSELPYYTIIKELTGMNNYSSQVTAGDSMWALSAVRPSGDSLGLDIQDSTNSSTFNDLGTTAFCPTCTLAVGIDDIATSLSIAGPINMDSLTIGNYAAIGNGATAELVSIVSINLYTNVLVIGRGVLDTTPKIWPAGTRLFFIEGFQYVGTDQFTPNETMYVRMLPSTSLGTLALASAPTDTYVFKSRNILPYPPANVYVNGIYRSKYAPGIIPNITWVGRDRTQETAGLIDNTQGNIGPETGVTYNITVQEAFNTVNANNASYSTTLSLTGVTGTSFQSLTSTKFYGCKMVFTVAAVRSGYTSWQSQVLTIVRGGFGINFGNHFGGDL